MRRLGRSVARVARTRYPRFVMGGSAPRGEIPVFVYHDVDPAEFRADLEFLRTNGYGTVTTDEFASRAGRSGGNRVVLLTFDDALQNFQDVALPLLEEFGAAATLFVPTFWMRGSATQVEGGSTGPRDRDEFLTWDGLRACRDSKLVDVQLHGHRHALVPTSGRLVGFATPALRDRQHLFDWPMRAGADGDWLGTPPLGTPVFASQPLLSSRRRVVEDAEAVGRCQAFVAEEGGAAFFESARWSERLRSVWNGGQKRAGPGRVVSGNAYLRLVGSEFDLAAALFRRELGFAPRFLAYPWMLGSEVSLDQARAAGIEAAFGVGLDYRRARRSVHSVAVFGRFKGDWLRFLPGRGRQRLLPVIARKARGFAAVQHLAH